jgi:hypothetical protein
MISPPRFSQSLSVAIYRPVYWVPVLCPVRICLLNMVDAAGRTKFLIQHTDYSGVRRPLAAAGRQAPFPRRAILPVHRGHRLISRTTKLPGTRLGRGCGWSAVAAGRGPKSPVTTKIFPEASSSAMVRAPRFVGSVWSTE